MLKAMLGFFGISWTDPANYRAKGCDVIRILIGIGERGIPFPLDPDGPSLHQVKEEDDYLIIFLPGKPDDTPVPEVIRRLRLVEPALAEVLANHVREYPDTVTVVLQHIRSE